MHSQTIRILSVVIAIGASVAPATAQAAASGSTTTGTTPAPQQYRTMRSMGRSKPRRPIDPKNPTWQDYNNAANDARAAHDLDKADKYAQASFVTLVKTMQKPQSALSSMSSMDHMIANALCVHQMYLDATAILKGPDVDKMTDAKELEELVDQQKKHFGELQTAFTVLKRVSPQQGEKLAFELTKCSTVMAKTKNKLEKAQAEAKSDAKTE